MSFTSNILCMITKNANLLFGGENGGESTDSTECLPKCSHRSHACTYNGSAVNNEANGMESARGL